MSKNRTQGRTIKPATAPAAATPPAPSPDAATATAAAEAAAGNQDPNASSTGDAGGASTQPDPNNATGVSTETAENRNADDAARTAGDAGGAAETIRKTVETATATAAAAGNGTGDEGEDPAEAAARRDNAAAAFREAALRGEDPAKALGIGTSLGTVSREANVERSASPSPSSPSAREAEYAADEAAASRRFMVGADVDGDGLVDGLRVIVAFTDATTGNRVGPGDPLPDHIREDSPRLERLYDGGFITDRPAERFAPRQVDGGLKVETRGPVNGEAQPIGDRRAPPPADPAADAS